MKASTKNRAGSHRSRAGRASPISRTQKKTRAVKTSIKATGAAPKRKRGPLDEARLLVRIKFSEEFQLGPGKIDLLDGIGRTGSISAAAREMDMSYRRAWLLVDEVSRMFRRPLVTRATGGFKGGGAELTEFGRALIAAYRRLQHRTESAVREELAAFESDLAV